MIAFIIFYWIFSSIVFLGFISQSLDYDESMTLKDYFTSLIGPLAFPVILGIVLQKIMLSDKI